MRFTQFACTMTFGVVVSLVASAIAEAGTMTFWDPVTRTRITYDPDKVRPPRPGIPPQPLQVAAPRTPPAVAPVPRAKPDPKFDRQVVAYETTEEPGTVIIDTKEKFLYHVLEDGQAIRYGVGVGREGFGWTGVVYVGSKQELPKWFPPPEMIQREPYLAKYVAEGMPGGDGNPLGLRALYLDDENGKDTLYRIHGTIEPWSIGLNVSSGCIRLLNENVLELYELVPVGTKVIVT